MTPDWSPYLGFDDDELAPPPLFNEPTHWEPEDEEDE